MGRHSAEPSRNRAVAAVAVPVVAIGAVAGGIYALTRGGDDGGSTGAASTSCSSPARVRVAAPIEISATVRSLTSGIDPAKSGCATFDVVDQDAQTTARTIAVAAENAPQIWITDSPLWVERVNQTLKDKPLEAGSTLATSPIGIAVPTPLQGAVPTGKQSLVDLFTKAGGKLPLRVADPETSSATLLGATTALNATGNDQNAALGLARTMVNASHTWSTDAELQLLAGTGGEKAQIFPASEQQMFQMNKTFPKAPVAAITLGEGDPLLDYRVVPVTNKQAPSDATVDAFTKALTSSSAVDALAAAGFRTTTSPGGPGVKGMAKDNKPFPLTLAQVDEAVRVTDAVGLDINMLTVMDVTGSMKQKAIGDLNRAQAATQAVQKAVQLFPEQTRLGLWEFAQDVNGKGKNYKEILPIQPLSTKVGNVTQQQAALGALQQMQNHLAGGTPLYETILAAYKASQAKYQANSTSAMVLVTDGKDEDSNTMTQEQLLAEIARVKDPKKPVKVILVGIGQDADMGALRTIAKATGGAAYNAKDPADIQNVVFDAMAQRITVATEL